MNSRLKAVATALLAANLMVPSGFASDATPPAKKHTARKKAPKGPTVEEQIQSLRQEMEGEINGLRQDLAAKDAQLHQAQQAAADAQAAAAKAQEAANQQQQAITENQSAVNALQTTVKDVNANTASLTSALSDETTAIKKSIASPEALNYKGITISPAGSFLEAATVWRSGGTGGDINTSLTGIPLEHAQAAQLSEFFGSARQSRLALKAVGKLPWGTLSGYYEMDWLGTGITSNDNQSNSYVMRQRQLWAEVAMNTGWTVNGGQMWSLATETTKGTSNGTEILPGTIDPQYTAGFVWTRQYGFRVSKNFAKKAWLAFSAENPETLNPAGQNIPTNILIGAPGTGGGLYNGTANYSFNLAPDFVQKFVIEPGWGHFEAFGIERFFRDRIYPTGGTPHNDSEIGGGVGGGFRGPLANKKLSVGLKGMYGWGVSRYGDSTIADVTVRPDGTLAPLTTVSGLATLEVNPNPRLSIYSNYGGDLVYRNYVTSGGKQIGYGTYTVNMSGCNTEPTTPGTTNPGFGGGTGFMPATPANCGANNKSVQEATFGYWYNFYNGPKGRLRQGIQYSYIRRDLWSGTGGPLNPNGGAHGVDNMVFTSLRYYLP
jgi:Skp family chaperone for outer membrane proteins